MVTDKRFDEACDFLFPLLAGRTPFRLLDVIGARTGKELPEAVNPFLDRVAAQRTMGGGTVVKRLGYFLEKAALDMPGVEQRLAAWQGMRSAGISLLEPGGQARGPVVTRWRG